MDQFLLDDLTLSPVSSPLPGDSSRSPPSSYSTFYTNLRNSNNESGLSNSNNNNGANGSSNSYFNSNVDDQPTYIVRLNIGGHYYETTNKTLTKISDTFFTALIANRMPSTVDKDGRYFIDRDGQFFAPILTYIRTCELSVPPNMTVDDVEREARFFLIHPLINLIDKMKNEERLTQMKKDNQLSANTLVENSSWKIYMDSYLAKYEKEINHFIKNRNKRGFLYAMIKFEIIESDNDWAPTVESLFPQNNPTLLNNLVTHLHNNVHHSDSITQYNNLFLLSQQQKLILYLKSCTDMLIDCFGEYFQSNGFFVEYSYSEQYILLWWNKLRRRGRDRLDLKNHDAIQAFFANSNSLFNLNSPSLSNKKPERK